MRNMSCHSTDIEISLDDIDFFEKSSTSDSAPLDPPPSTKKNVINNG